MQKARLRCYSVLRHGAANYWRSLFGIDRFLPRSAIDSCPNHYAPTGINLREGVIDVIHYHVAKLLTRQHPDVIRESLQAPKGARTAKFLVWSCFFARGAYDDR